MAFIHSLLIFFADSWNNLPCTKCQQNTHESITQYLMSILLKFVSNKNVDRRADKQNTNEMFGLLEIPVRSRFTHLKGQQIKFNEDKTKIILSNHNTLTCQN